MNRITAAVFVALAWLAVDAVSAEPRLPIFDTHVHYSRPAWKPYGPAAIVAALDAADVRRALVSSTPDDGSLMLHEHDPARFVPMLRPYRTRADMADWFGNQEILDYLVERLERGVHQGIGEFHLRDAGAVETPQMRRIVALAVARGIPLHVHSGAEPVRALFALDPGLKVLWAHAGFSEPPEVVGDMLERYANLSTEVSFRAGDIAPGGRLDPDWEAVLRRHSDRLMIGTDTYITSRWDSYGALIEEHRRWLAQLPREIAKAIAYRNAARHFGDGGIAALRD